MLSCLLNCQPQNTSFFLNLLFGFSLILIFALILGIVFIRLRLPLLASYILSGFILGLVFRFSAADNKLFLTISDIGVIFLLFSLGLEFPLKKILDFKSQAFKITFLQSIFITVCLFILLSAFKFSPPIAITAAILFSFSSTVLVVKILSEKGGLHTTSGEILTAILVLQDLIILPLSIFLPLIFEFKEFNLGLILNFFIVLAKSTGIFILIILFAKKVIPRVLQRVSRFLQNDLMILSIICLSLFFAGLAERLGFSLTIGAFVAGMVISATSARHAVFSEIRPLRDIFSIIFFIFLGFSIDGVYVGQHILQIVSLAAIIIIIKFFTTYFLAVLIKIHQKNAMEIAINLAQISEFAFILFSLYFSRGLIKKADYQLIVSVSLLTIIISPFLISAFLRITKKMHFVGSREKLRLVLENDNKLARHVVLCGYGRIGTLIVKQLILNNIPFIVIDNNREDVDKLRNRGYTAVYGDATEIEILKFSGVDAAKVIIVAIPDRFTQEIIISHARRLNPRVFIYCRVHEEKDKKYLYAAGAQFVLFPEFEGAFVLSKRVLKLYGIDDSVINESLKISRYS